MSRVDLGSRKKPYIIWSTMARSMVQTDVKPDRIARDIEIRDQELVQHLSCNEPNRQGYMMATRSLLVGWQAMFGRGRHQKAPTKTVKTLGPPLSKRHGILTKLAHMIHMKRKGRPCAAGGSAQEANQ